MNSNMLINTAGLVAGAAIGWTAKTVMARSRKPEEQRHIVEAFQRFERKLFAEGYQHAQEIAEIKQEANRH